MSELEKVWYELGFFRKNSLNPSLSEVLGFLIKKTCVSWTKRLIVDIVLESTQETCAKKKNYYFSTIFVCKLEDFEGTGKKINYIQNKTLNLQI